MRRNSKTRNALLGNARSSKTCTKKVSLRRHELVKKLVNSSRSIISPLKVIRINRRKVTQVDGWVEVIPGATDDDDAR